MRYVLQPLRVVWKIWFLVLFVTTLTLFYPIFNHYLSDESGHKRCFHWMRKWSRWLLAASGIKVDVDQRGDLPEGPFIICANHGSYLDIITMYMVFERPFAFVGKVEINNWPLIHIFFSKGMNISVDRASPMRAHNALEQSKEKLLKGINVIIFPEGTIPGTAPKMKAFKSGAFKLSMESGVPIVPLTFVTNWKRLQTGAALKALGSPGVSKVVVHPAVSPEQYAESGVVKMKQDIFDTINKPLTEAYGDQ